MQEKSNKLFYGWIIVGCLFLITALPMVFQSNFFSYYQVPVSQDLGVDYVQFSTTNIFNTVAGMVFGIFLAGKVCAGRVRLAMVIGAIGSAISCFLQSYVTQIWQFWCLGFIINVFMNCFTYTPINFIISRWFVDKKGLATSIVFAGGGVGGAIFSKPFANMLAEHGWRYCYRVTGIIVLVVVLFVALMIRKDPSEKGIEPLMGKKLGDEDKKEKGEPALIGVTKAEAVKTGSFYLYAATLILVGMAAAGIMTHVPTYLIEAELDYATIMVFYSFGAIVAQIIMGALYDKIGLAKGVIVNAAVGIIALVLLLSLTLLGTATPYIAMLLLALGSCVSSLLPPLLTGSCFGNKEFGGIYGIGNTFFMAGCMIGPMLSAAVREGTGSYSLAWIIYMGVFAGIFLCSAFAIKCSPLNAKK